MNESPRKLLCFFLMNGLDMLRGIVTAQAAYAHGKVRSLAPNEVLALADDIQPEEAMHISNLLDIFLINQVTVEEVQCPICLESKAGTVEEMGQFLAHHKEFHDFRYNIRPIFNIDAKGESGYAGGTHG
jgi:hypothetical protein